MMPFFGLGVSRVIPARWSAAVFCLNDDARNLYGAVLARRHGVGLTIALAHDPGPAEV